jgi:hypothetical protein
MIKKRVAILYSGQIRTNSLNDNYTADTIILDSVKEFFLNGTFNEKYDYDVFFSTNSMNIEKAKTFFGEHLKNIHLTEQNWYMNPIRYITIPFSEIYQKYMETTDFDGCEHSSHHVHQFYRLYCAYKLAKDYEFKNNVTYDYYVRIRPDSRLMQDVNPLFHIMETTSKEIIMEHDHLCIVNKNYEEFFQFIFYYGFFTKPVDIYHWLYSHYTKERCMPEDSISRFCPERQIIEYVYMIIAQKKQHFHDVFLGITYPSFNLLYRGDGLYGYGSYEEYMEKYPYDKIEDIMKNL